MLLPLSGITRLKIPNHSSCPVPVRMRFGWMTFHFRFPEPSQTHFQPTTQPKWTTTLARAQFCFALVDLSHNIYPTTQKNSLELNGNRLLATSNPLSGTASHWLATKPRPHHVPNLPDLSNFRGFGLGSSFPLILALDEHSKWRWLTEDCFIAQTPGTPRDSPQTSR